MPHLVLRVPVRPLGMHKAHVPHLVPEYCVFDFQTCCGGCSGTSGVSGQPRKVRGQDGGAGAGCSMAASELRTTSPVEVQ